MSDLNAFPQYPDCQLCKTDILGSFSFMPMPTERHLAYDEFQGYRVSTVRLLSADFMPESYPFETMIFYGDSSKDLACERYKSADEAIAGHKSMLEDLKLNLAAGVRI